MPYFKSKTSSKQFAAVMMTVNYWVVAMELINIMNVDFAYDIDYALLFL